jgi:uncharacterized membrane protein
VNTIPPAYTAPKVQWEWIAAGWNLFLQQWQPWVLNILIFMTAMFVPVGLIMVASFASLSLLNEKLSPAAILTVITLTLLLLLLTAAVQSFLAAGLYRSAFKQLQGGQVELADLFSGTDVFVPMFAVNLIIMGASLIGLFFCILPAFLVAGLCFFAAPLVALRRSGPIRAIKTSIETTKHDLLPFTLFAVTVYLLAGIGGNLCYVGLLATYPLLFTVTAVAFRDCLGGNTAGPR